MLKMRMQTQPSVAKRCSNRVSTSETGTCEVLSNQRTLQRMTPHVRQFAGGPNYDRFLQIYKSRGSAALVESLRNFYEIGAEDEYRILAEKDWVKEVKKMGYPPGDVREKDGGTVGGLYSSQKAIPITFLGENLIQEKMESGELGDLITTLRHEYEHVRQKNSPSYPSEYKGADSRHALAEFEAYKAEIDSADALLGQKSQEAVDQMPSDQLLAEAVFRAIRHYYKLSEEKQAEYKGFFERIDKLWSSSDSGRRIVLALAEEKYPGRESYMEKIRSMVENEPYVRGQFLAKYEPRALRLYSPDELLGVLRDLHLWYKEQSRQERDWVLDAPKDEELQRLLPEGGL